VGVKRSRRSSLRGIVHVEAGPKSIRAVTQVTEMPDHRKRVERERAERKNRRDRKRRILIVRLNGALGRNDGPHSANCGAHRQQRRKFGFELKKPTEKGHERERTDDLNRYK